MSELVERGERLYEVVDLYLLFLRYFTLPTPKYFVALVNS